MRPINRKTISRAGALMLVLILLFSFTASYAAASFTKSKAGVKYSKKSYKLGASVTASQLKKAFGKWSSHKTDNGCTCGYATHKYTFKSKGLVIETLQKKKNSTKQQIITITASSKKVPTIDGIKVGSTVKSVTSKYGKKYSKSGSKLLFSTGKYYLVVYTKNNKVTKYKFILDL